MIACPSCGTANPDGARFCMACATPLEIPGPSREARKVVTVVFADITGSTGLGERLDPESLRAIMGRWFEAMRAVLEHHGGTVEKFIGDAVVAVFGVPVVHEDDALRAVRSAVDMEAALLELNVALRAERDLEIEMRVGVNTGEVVVGDARAGGSRATGDAVNVAARLQQAAEPGESLLGDSTWRLVRDAAVTGEPREVHVKGRDEPVIVRRLLSVDRSADAIHRRVGGAMVGRDRELGILRGAYERSVVEERCVLVTVLGSAGVGKSRLVQEFLASAEGATVLRGRCLPYGGGITWYPVAGLLRSAVGLGEDAEPSAVLERLRRRLDGITDADQILARLAEPLGVTGEPAPIEELVWAIRRFVERVATGGPVVLVIDDLQWAEATLLDLVEHLAGWVHGVPVLLLAMARPELLEIRAGWGGGKPDATTFLLEPLPSSDTEQLVRTLLEGASIPAAAVARIATAADGNPLYVEQVVEMLLDDGVVRRLRDGSLEVRDLETISVPPTIHALLAARLDRLSEAERRTIERAAVVGKEFGQRDVSELTPADGREGLSRSLMSLVRKELIRPDRRRDDGGETYRFRHLLIRDAAYDSLPKSERADLHEQFADWLDRAVGDRIADLDEIIGFHLDQARAYRLALGPEDDRTRSLALRAGRRLAAAGERAADREDPVAGARLLTRAADLLVSDPPARYQALMLLLSVGFPFDYAAAMQAARQAEQVGEQLGELAARRASIWVASARAMTDPDFRISDTRAETELAAQAFEAEGDVEGLLDAYAQLNQIDLALAHWEDSLRWAQLGLDLATRAGRERMRGTFAMWVSNALTWGSMDASASIALMEGLVATATRRLTKAAIFDSIAVLKGVLGDRPGADAARGEAAAIFDELGHQHREFRDAFMEYALDDFGAAVRLTRAEAADLERRGDTGQRSTMLGLQSWTLALLGDDQDAAAAAATAYALSAPDDAVSQILWRAGLGLVEARRGNAAEADRLTHEATEVAAETDSMEAGTAWLARAMALASLGRTSEASDAAREARRLFALKGSVNAMRRAEALITSAGSAGPR
ncbi:MAG: adenylate/guanylate cyclase domain-containing protein [Candidatus Limnocylindrales bacterium]